MPAGKISLEHAKQDKLFYFVANAMIYRQSDGRCLILKRSEREKVHPGKYCTPGGKLEWNQFDLTRPTRINGEVIDFEHAIEDLLTREVHEEAGIELETSMQYLNGTVFVRPDGIPVVMLKFAVQYKSGEVKLEEGSFSDYVWVVAEEVKKLDCIEGIAEEVAAAIKMFD